MGRCPAVGLAFALCVACGGASAQQQQQPVHEAVAPRAAPEPPKPEPPKPLPSETVTLSQKSDFARLELGGLETPLPATADIEKNLPAGARASYRAVIRARDDQGAAESKVYRVLSEMAACEDCREQRQLEAKQKIAQANQDRVDRAASRTIEASETALEKLLASKQAVPVVGVVLSRLRASSSIRDRDEFHSSFDYGEAMQHGDNDAIAPLERAAELVGPGEELGRNVRLELIYRLMSTRRAAEANKWIAEISPVAPAEWRSELEFRAGVLAALAGDDTGAAARFEKALELHQSTSSVSKSVLIAGLLAASYRSEQYEGVIANTFRLYEEAARPPPPKPAPAPAPAKATSSRANTWGLLASLGTLGSFDQRMPEETVVRLAADAVERLGRDPTALDGSIEPRSAILSRLAVRALYRHDDALAKRYAEAARALGKSQRARDAFLVLETLTQRDGDAGKLEELKKERTALPYKAGFGMASVLSGSTREPDAKATETKSTTPKRSTSETPEPAAASNVRSVLRICIEPLRNRLPAAAKGTKRIALLEISAEVFTDGTASLKGSFDRADPTLDRVLTCIRELGPRALGHAPSSVVAKVELMDSARSSASIFGDSDLEGFGSIGLGSGIGVGRSGSGSGSAIRDGGTGLGGLGGLGGSGKFKPVPKPKR